jgi:hypothetical protein
MSSLYFKSARKLGSHHAPVRNTPYLLSEHSDRERLTLEEVLVFLSNLRYATCSALNATTVPSFDKQAFIKCTADHSDTTCFHIYLGVIAQRSVFSFPEPNLSADADFIKPNFSISISHYCHHQQCFKPSLPIEGPTHGRLITYLSKPTLSDQTDFDPDHPFRVIGKYIYKSFKLAPHLRQHLLSRWYSKSRHYFIKLRQGPLLILDAMLRDHLGKSILYISQQQVNIGDVNSQFYLTHESNIVPALVWIPPWTISLFRKSSYIELDTSFRAFKPYVYSIPLAIHANESFPLALIVGISESKELYDLFFAAMESIGITQEKFKRKPFLTDQHKALKAVCGNGIHFLCYRHLIENFGSNSPFGQIVRRLAFSSTPEEFIYQAEISMRDLRALESRAPLDQQKLRRLFKRFGTGNSWDNWAFSVESWDNQSLWKRAEYGVATCSNHIEGLHRAVNDIIKLTLPLINRLQKLIELLNNRYDSATLYKHEQGTRLLNKLQQQQRDRGIVPVETCQDHRCGWKQFYSALLNINYFPCIHEAGLKEVEFYDPGQEQQGLDQDQDQDQESQDQDQESVRSVPTDVELKEYVGEWEIPQQIVTNSLKISGHNPEDECQGDSETESMSGFISNLLTEVMSISKQDLPYRKLMITLSLRYGMFLEKNGDSEEKRSIFRAECWLEAEAGNVALW